MSIAFNYAAMSDVGLVRKNNQDAGYASQHLLVLADGMGGAAAGDIASSVTVSHLAEIDDSHSPDELLPFLREALVAAQHELSQRVQEDPSMAGLGTTCIAIMRVNNKLAMTHIGDSRAYLLRGEKLTQVTHDHTLVQYLVDHGELTAEEAEHHPKRNVIMRAISDTPESVDLDESVREAIPGDRWLLCSDGLFGVVSTETIKATLLTYKNVHECAEVLISLALAGGAPDNVTIVIADVIDDADLPSDTRLPSEPVVVGSAAADYFRPSRGSISAAGQAAALLPEQDEADTAHRKHHTRKHRKFAKILAGLSIFAAILGLGSWACYSWIQTQYFVAPDAENQYVVIYRGIPQKIGSISFYRTEEETNLKIEMLNAAARERLTVPITRTSLDEARHVVSNLKAQQHDEKSQSLSNQSPQQKQSADDEEDEQ